MPRAYVFEVTDSDGNDSIPADLAQRAFAGTSFSPERRGETARAEYKDTLAADLETLRQHATQGGTLDMLGDEFDRYRAGLRRRYTAWLASESRCVSSFIAGPSNFPVRRMQKRSDIAHRRLGDYIEFRNVALAAAIRNLRPDLRPIMAGDDNAIERLTAEIAKAEAVQDRMKQANAAIRRAKKAGPEAQVAALVELGFAEPRAHDLLKPDCCGRIGFADFELTNNGANIRRMKERLEKIGAAKARPDTQAQGEHALMELCPGENRIRLTFPGKPDASVRDTLKGAGFRWTPSLGVWQSYINHRAMDTARTVAGLKSSNREEV